MAGEVELIERFWLDLWNRRAMDEMLALFHPDWTMRDHQPMSMWGETLEDWRRMVESWWSFAPDVRIVEVNVLRVEEGRAVYHMLSRGTDTITGGTAEVAVYVVNRFRDGTFAAADIFADEASALACYGAL